MQLFQIIQDGISLSHHGGGQISRIQRRVLILTSFSEKIAIFEAC